MYECVCVCVSVCVCACLCECVCVQGSSGKVSSFTQKLHEATPTSLPAKFLMFFLGVISRDASSFMFASLAGKIQ